MPGKSLQRAPLRHLLICANPSAASFSHAIVNTYVAEVTARYQQVIVRDLYVMGFDPVLRTRDIGRGPDWTPARDVAEELDLLTSCDMLVLVYPIWFGTPPAILKGYVDRVLGAGFDIHAGKGGAGRAALQGKPLLSLTTSGMPLPWLAEQGQVLSLRNLFDAYVARGLGMPECDHVSMDCILPGLGRLSALEQLERVRHAATLACASLSAVRHARDTAEAVARQEHRRRGPAKVRARMPSRRLAAGKARAAIPPHTSTGER